MRFITWLKRLFKRPVYSMRIDTSDGRSYWSVAEITPEGIIRIVAAGDYRAYCPTSDVIEWARKCEKVVCENDDNN